jgi:hypothetical protein
VPHSLTWIDASKTHGEIASGRNQAATQPSCAGSSLAGPVIAHGLPDVRPDFVAMPRWHLPSHGSQEIVITRHGQTGGVLIGFASEEDWFEYRLEHDPRFLRRIEQARNSLRAGRGTRLEELETE